MTKKLSARLFYSLVLSIMLLMIGFLGLGVRAFASAAIADFIFLGALGVVLVALTIYFALNWPFAGAARNRKIWPASSAWPGQVPQHVASGRNDRRKPLVVGQKRAAVARERRTRQLAGFRTVSIRPVASETLRG